MYAIVERSSVIIEVGLLLGLHFGDAVHVVLVREEGASPPEGAHAGLDAHGLELRAVEVLGGPGQLHEVDLLVHHLPGVDLQDLHARLLVGQRELDLPVQPAGPQERGVEHVGPVGGRDYLDVVVRRES